MSKTSGGSANQFMWDLAGRLPLLLKDGTTAYVYGPSGLPLEQVSGSTTYYFHHDQIGSTRLLTDSTGSSQATYQFDPYGNLVASTGSIANPFQFCGQYRDPEAGLYYLRARYYDPTTGQFTTPDPAVTATREPYAYSIGNPLNASDPSGLSQTYGGPPGCEWPDLGGSMCPLDTWSGKTQSSQLLPGRRRRPWERLHRFGCIRSGVRRNRGGARGMFGTRWRSIRYGRIGGNVLPRRGVCICDERQSTK
jgi:RHS repeat-associated protein